MNAKIIINLIRGGNIETYNPVTFKPIGFYFPFEFPTLVSDKRLSEEQRQVVEFLIRKGNRPLKWGR